MRDRRIEAALNAAERCCSTPDLVPEGGWEWWSREWRRVEQTRPACDESRRARCHELWPQGLRRVILSSDT